jgi:predicted 3-demethylubiquinone-9 3-methyltransferase (glyoxalase superfamily)
MQKIIPCLWFNNQAEEATRFYTAIFKNSKLDNISYYGDAGPGTKGTVLMTTFQLNGQEIMALNGGPEYKFTPAISLFVNCENQEEVDYFWEQLSEGGEKGPCGWLTDKFGVSWQIVPTILGILMGDKDENKAARVMQAMLQMTKLDIKILQQAYNEG